MCKIFSIIVTIFIIVSRLFFIFILLHNSLDLYNDIDDQYALLSWIILTRLQSTLNSIISNIFRFSIVYVNSYFVFQLCLCIFIHFSMIWIFFVLIYTPVKLMIRIIAINFNNFFYIFFFNFNNFLEFSYKFYVGLSLQSITIFVESLFLIFQRKLNA